MRQPANRIAALTAGLLCLVLLGYTRYVEHRRSRRSSEIAALALASEKAHRHVDGWPLAARSAAELLIARYGPPTAVFDQSVVWIGKYPWKRIVVNGEASDVFLEQTVDHDFRPDTVELLEEFDHRLRSMPMLNELTARADSESLNLLVLNLADDVSSKRRSPEQARAFYMRTKALWAAGKSSPYMESLLFHPRRPSAFSRGWGETLVPLSW